MLWLWCKENPCHIRSNQLNIEGNFCKFGPVKCDRWKIYFEAQKIKNYV